MEVLVVEQTGECVKALRRLLTVRAGQAPVPRVVEVPSASAAIARAARPQSAFVLIVADDLSQSLDAARQIGHQVGNFSFAVVAPAAVVALWHGQTVWQAWLAAVRQAGAVDVAYSLVELPRVADTIVRCQRQVPGEPIGLRETVWSRLPWSNSAALG